MEIMQNFFSWFLTELPNFLSTPPISYLFGLILGLFAVKLFKSLIIN